MPVVNKALDGYNVTIFTYGMTGSGRLPQCDPQFRDVASTRYTENL